uniref:DUF4408 domain-containing protein n=1 Tax=Kalanchoe fedtschenkoi TaxID=63787 RepID=A0A7N0T8B2_KALFE
MESFHATTLKFGKQNGLKRLGSVFRALEIFVFLVMVWRVSFEVRFPAVECVRRFLSALLSHRSVFIIGNVIVITLFAKSGNNSLSDQNPKLEKQNVANDESASGGAGIEHTVSIPVPDSVDLERSDSARVKQKSIVAETVVKAGKGNHAFKRSYSECLEVEGYVKPRRILRRTVTEGGRRAVASDGGEAAEGVGDGMSDEEFRVMVETFIAKQQRSLREEEKCLAYC